MQLFRHLVRLVRERTDTRRLHQQLRQVQRIPDERQPRRWWWRVLDRLLTRWA